MTIQDAELFSGVVPFVHVAEALSFRRAAEALGVSTAAVSKAVATLEARIGARLLRRTSRAVALTPEGAAFLTRCREAVASVRAGRAQLAGLRDQPRGEVRVTASLLLGAPLVRALPALLGRYPDLRVHLALTDRIAGLASEDVDVALRVGARASSGLRSRVLLRPRWVTVAAPALVARHGAPAQPADLAGLPCVRYAPPSGRPPPWWFADERGAARPFTPAARLTVDQGERLIDAAVAGVGVTQVLDFMAAAALGDGRLVELLTGRACPGPPVHAVTTPERTGAATVRAVIDFAASVFARPR